jgi:hypothetical protein
MGQCILLSWFAGLCCFDVHCAPLCAAGIDPKVSCPVTVRNDGNVGLGALEATASGYGLTCADTSVLDAGATRACTLTRSVNQVSLGPVADQRSWLGGANQGRGGGVPPHGRVCTSKPCVDRVRSD